MRSMFGFSMKEFEHAFRRMAPPRPAKMTSENIASVLAVSGSMPWHETLWHSSAWHSSGQLNNELYEYFKYLEFRCLICNSIVVMKYGGHNLKRALLHAEAHIEASREVADAIVAYVVMNSADGRVDPSDPQLQVEAYAAILGDEFRSASVRHEYWFSHLSQTKEGET